jgi:predicted enzyme related to lactoylglutathione lyase
MATFPDAFGMSVTVDDVEAASRFYAQLYPHDAISRGVFAGIPYIGIMRDGETLVNIFQRGEQNPLAAVVPILKVAAVADAADDICRLGGRVLLDASNCPCTGSTFAVCVDPNGVQFMIKEPRTTAPEMPRDQGHAASTAIQQPIYPC